MSVKFKETPDGIVVSLSGEIDHHAARGIIKEINSRMDEYVGTVCILDMDKVGFIDSSGIAILLILYRKMEEVGGRLRVRKVPDQAMKVFDAAGLRRLAKFE